MLFDRAVEFATQVGREKVISISHSEDRNNGVVVVWYWESASPPTLDYSGETPVPVAAFDDFGDGIRGPDPSDLIDEESGDRAEDEEDIK